MTTTREFLQLKRRALRAAQGLWYWSGACETVKPRAAATILMYHSVAPAADARFVDPGVWLSPQEFERQLRFVSRFRNVMSLSALVSTLGVGAPIPAGTVAITFDDGYRDNLLIAGPLLERYALPATLFLPTLYIDGAETQWVDRLCTVFSTRRNHQLELGSLLNSAQLASTGLQSSSFDLRQRDKAAQAYRACCSFLIESVYEQRDPLIRGLSEQLQPIEAPPRLTMKWEEVTQLRDRFPLIDIGVHTATHLDLSTQEAPRIRQELADSVGRVEEQLDLRPMHFSFPYGRSSAVARQIVAAHGFVSAVGDTDVTYANAQSDRFCLPRLDAKLDITQFRFRTHASFSALPRVLTGGL